MPQLPRGMFTNFTPVAPKGPLDVLVLDGLNTQIIDQAYFRQQLLDYLSKVPPGARIAIFGMADHLYMLQGFTSDPAVLRAVLSSTKANPHAAIATGSAITPAALTDPSGGPPSSAGPNAGGPPLSGGGSALMTSAVDSFLEHVTVAQTALRIEKTIEDLSQLAHYLLNFPGRKNVVWASSAFPLGVFPGASTQTSTDIPSEDSDIYRRMVNLFTEAQISIYPIDARGLNPEPVFQASSSASQGLGLRLLDCPIS